MIFSNCVVCGNGFVRRTNAIRCRDCQQLRNKEANKRYRLEDPKRAEKRRQSYLKHRETHLRASKEWALRNPEKVRLKSRDCARKKSALARAARNIIERVNQNDTP